MATDKNPELRSAWEFVENTGTSIFLTGKAGTGKTTFLRTVVARSTKQMIVVAPTGVAAINAGGVTIHSFFQLDLAPHIPGAKVNQINKFSKEKRKIIASIDLLIIDEISMVRCDLLDAIDSVLRRYRDHSRPFGGVQLLMIGDLAQLTPVVTPEDDAVLSQYYDTPYFFGSKALQQINYVTIQLQKIYRQADSTFVDILNHIREGHITAADFETLHKRYNPSFTPKTEEGYIRLTTHNRKADEYNDHEMQRLNSQPFTYEAEIDGTFPEYSYPTAFYLTLKVGAQVMFIKNDVNGKYFNGKIGHVVALGEKSIQVRCVGEDENINVGLQEWENAKYSVDPDTHEVKSEVQGVFRQYPLRLAWAITIHKSQGLTFDRAIIDAGQSFAPGQVYVALSRCRSLEGLVIASKINDTAIINDVRVDNYISRQEENAENSIRNDKIILREVSMKNKNAKIFVNSITMVRLIGTITLPIASKYLSTWGLIIYLAILLLTDAFDGMMARRLKASTLFGSLLDTSADKLLALAALAALTKNYLIMFLPITTEIIIMIVNIKGALKGAITESRQLGKIKTWVLGLSIVFGFLTLLSPELITLTKSNIFINLLASFIKNSNLIMIILASITTGAGIIVFFDYRNQINKDIKKAKEEGYNIKYLKIKEKEDLKYALFDTEYYLSTRDEPLIKKIGVINYEKIKNK